MSFPLTEENKKQDISDQDESSEKKENEFLENKRKRTRLQYKKTLMKMKTKKSAVF
jgi:hypothetical protein